MAVVLKVSQSTLAFLVIPIDSIGISSTICSQKLFKKLDVNVFNGKLSKVVVEWGSMAECASVCYKIVAKSQIVIRLSQPLLGSQINKILLETLLVSISYNICHCNCLRPTNIHLNLNFVVFDFSARNDPRIFIHQRHR